MYTNCDFIRQYGSCSEACDRFNVRCLDVQGRKWTTRDYIREALIAISIVAGISWIVLG